MHKKFSQISWNITNELSYIFGSRLLCRLFVDQVGDAREFGDHRLSCFMQRAVVVLSPSN